MNLLIPVTAAIRDKVDFRRSGEPTHRPAPVRVQMGLTADYPMVAPGYAENRSALARTIGLGRKAAPEPEPIQPEKPKRTRRPKQAEPE